MAPPEHRIYRQIVSKRFTPRALAQLREPIEAVTLELMDTLALEGSSCELDFVERVDGTMIRSPKLLIVTNRQKDGRFDK